MHAPVTFLMRVQQAGILLLFVGLVFVIGKFLLRIIGKSSLKRRRHGVFVLGWMFTGYLIGAAIGLVLIDNQTYFLGEADVGMACSGMLGGWVIGMCHGGIMLAARPCRSVAEIGTTSE
jgi:hypothetical protein